MHNSEFTFITFFVTKENVTLKTEVLSSIGYETQFEGTVKNGRIVSCMKRNGEYHTCTENMYDKE